MFYKLDIERQTEISTLFKNFFKYLSDDFEKNIFYKNNSGLIIKDIRSVVFHDGSNINLNYLDVNNFRREIKNKKLNIRVSYYETKTTNTVDQKGTEKSVRANLIHATDAFFARLIILNFHCLTVHDCFMLRLNDINTCLDFMNKFFRDTLCERYGDEARIYLLVDDHTKYSITIVL